MPRYQSSAATRQRHGTPGNHYGGNFANGSPETERKTVADRRAEKAAAKAMGEASGKGEVARVASSARLVGAFCAVTRYCIYSGFTPLIRGAKSGLGRFSNSCCVSGGNSEYNLTNASFGVDPSYIAKSLVSLNLAVANPTPCSSPPSIAEFL